MKKTIKRKRPYNEGVLEVLKITATKKGCNLKYHPSSNKCIGCEYATVCAKSQKEIAAYKGVCERGTDYLLYIAKEMKCSLHLKESTDKCANCPYQSACFESPNSRRKIHKDWEKRRKQERAEAAEKKQMWFDLIEEEDPGDSEEDNTECKDKCQAYPTKCTGKKEHCVNVFKVEDFEP